MPVALLFGASVAVFLFNQYELFVSDMAAYDRREPGAYATKQQYTRVTIDFGDGTRRAFWGPVQNGMTAMLALRASQEAGQFNIETDDAGRITNIAGIRAQNGKAWRLFINDAPASDVSGNIEIQPGDQLVFRYQ